MFPYSHLLGLALASTISNGMITKVYKIISDSFLNLQKINFIRFCHLGDIYLI